MKTKQEQQAETISLISRIGQELAQYRTPFTSRMTVTVQAGNAINVKKRLQFKQTILPQPMDSIESATKEFADAFKQLFDVHTFFMASIEIAFDGNSVTIEPVTCENSIRLTA